jgi:hypothetical protein
MHGYTYEHLIKNYYFPRKLDSMLKDQMKINRLMVLCDPVPDMFEGLTTDSKRMHPSYKERLEICKKYKEEAIAKGVVPSDFDDTSCWFYPKKSLWMKITDSLFKS